jgi:hypothetical protein
MKILLDIVRSTFDPLANALGVQLYWRLTLAELIACAVLVVVYEILRQANPVRFRQTMQVISGALVPLILLAVFLIIYRFDRLA